eukprot:752110-Hanusia_phi.AAC.2
MRVNKELRTGHHDYNSLSRKSSQTCSPRKRAHDWSTNKGRWLESLGHRTMGSQSMDTVAFAQLDSLQQAEHPHPPLLLPP